MGLPRGKMSMVVGGQAGSEAKGKLSGYLCHKFNPDLLVMSASPNAGHTVVMPDGTKKVSYHLPIGSVMCDADIILTATSLINLETLKKEISDLGIDPERIVIDPRASIITSSMINREVKGGMSNIGSTLQGIGECRVSKMARNGHHRLAAHEASRLQNMGVTVTSIPTSRRIGIALGNQKTVLCEGTQGFDLDLEHGIHHRYCTSKMINPSMMAAEAGVPPQMVGEIYGVIRPYPIRVNNRTGTSGPYAEASEITWDDVARRCGFPGSPDQFGEVTTTTKLPRRVFEFCWSRFRHFVRVCGPTVLCLQFANYIDWSIYGQRCISEPVREFIYELENFSGVPVMYVGTGPDHDQMVEIGEEVL